MESRSWCDICGCEMKAMTGGWHCPNTPNHRTALPPSTGAPDLRAEEALMPWLEKIAERACLRGWKRGRMNLEPEQRTIAMDVLHGGDIAEGVMAALALPLQPAGDLREVVAAEIVLFWQKWHAYRGKVRFADFPEHDKADFYGVADRILALLGGGKREGNPDVPPPKTGAVPSGQGEKRPMKLEAKAIGDSFNLRWVNLEGREVVANYGIPFRVTQEIAYRINAFEESPSPATRSDEVAEGPTNGN